MVFFTFAFDRNIHYVVFFIKMTRLKSFPSVQVLFTDLAFLLKACLKLIKCKYVMHVCVHRLFIFLSFPSLKCKFIISGSFSRTTRTLVSLLAPGSKWAWWPRLPILPGLTEMKKMMTMITLTDPGEIKIIQKKSFLDSD